MHAGRVVFGAGGASCFRRRTSFAEGIVGTYRQNQRGFGFVVPTDPDGHEDLFIPEGENGGAITGDVVRAKITNREQREGKVMYRGRVIEIITRSQKRFVGTLAHAAREMARLARRQRADCADSYARCRGAAYQAGHQSRRRTDDLSRRRRRRRRASSPACSARPARRMSICNRSSCSSIFPRNFPMHASIRRARRWIGSTSDGNGRIGSIFLIA